MDVAKERNDVTTTLSNQNSLKNVDKFAYLGSTIHRAPVAQLVEHRAVTREVVSSTPA